jgi:hypothetical protein
VRDCCLTPTYNFSAILWRANLENFEAIAEGKKRHDKDMVFI